MKKIVLDKSIEEEHLIYFKKNISKKLKNTPELKNTSFQRKADKLFLYFNDNVENIAISKPAMLKEIIKDVNKIFPNYSKQLLKQENKTLSEYLLSIFGYKKFSLAPKKISDKAIDFQNFYDKDDSFFKEWSAYKLVFSSKIRVCPYCNRQFITPIYVRERKTQAAHLLRPDIDHFYSKAKYPYLSMSLYNLVPCCKFCNSSLKGTKEIKLVDINPYEESYDEFFNFKYDFINNKILIEKKDLETRKISNLLEIFQIENLYQYHQNIALELIKKKKIYPDSHIKELFENHPELFNSEKEVNELVFNLSHETSKLNDEVLLKLKRDLANQLDIF